MTPPPPVPFPPVNTHRIKAGTSLTRIHDKAFGARIFNPGLGSPTRFAPLIRPNGDVIPHMYAAFGYECAAHETVFHEIQFDAPVKTIAAARLDPLTLSEISCRRDLVLAALFEPDLNQWRMRRADLIDTFASAYPDTVRWALAIHDASRVDGLVWTSKRCDPYLAMVLFGDRVDTAELDEHASDEIAASATLYGQLRGFGRRAGIDIV